MDPIYRPVGTLGRLFSMLRLRLLLLMTLSLGLLQACQDPEPEVASKEPGLPTLNRVIHVVGGTASLPPAARRTVWTQAAGRADHDLGHAVFSQNPAEVWSHQISTPMQRGRLSSMEPLIYGDQVFTLSWDMQVVALTLSTGQPQWRQDLKAIAADLSNDRAVQDAFGGGLALMNGRLFAATGTGHLHALDLGTGAIDWTVPLPAPSRAGPLAYEGRLYISDILGGLNVYSTSGGQLWSQAAPRTLTAILAPNTPAGASGGLYQALPNGVIQARTPQGELAWEFDTAVQGSTGSLSDQISDTRALLVADDGLLIASGWANRTLALRLNTGLPVWEIPIGGVATPALTPAHVFIITKDGVLRALQRTTGHQIWSTDLGRENPNSRPVSVGWQGPLMAGGQLIVGSSEGVLKFLDPKTGAVFRQIDLEQPLIAPLSLAGETLLVTTRDGYIRAFR